MGVPPNHPLFLFDWDFPLQTIQLLGIPHLWKPPYVQMINHPLLLAAKHLWMVFRPRLGGCFWRILYNYQAHYRRPSETQCETQDPSLLFLVKARNISIATSNVFLLGQSQGTRHHHVVVFWILGWIHVHPKPSVSNLQCPIILVIHVFPGFFKQHGFVSNFESQTFNVSWFSHQT